MMDVFRSDTVVSAGATGAITSPWWLPSLHNVSEIAASVAPILGVIWLLVQIIVKIDEATLRRRRKR